VVVHNISEDKFGTDSINQMFRKFNHMRNNSKDLKGPESSKTGVSHQRGSSYKNNMHSPKYKERSVEKEKVDSLKKATLEKGVLNVSSKR